MTNSDRFSSNHQQSSISRRQLLKGASGAAVLTLAGCSSNDGEGDVTPVGGEQGTDGQEGGSSGDLPEFHTYLPGAIESQSQIVNPWGQNTHALAWAVHPHLARWSTSAEFNRETSNTYNQFVPLGAKSLDIDQENGVITLGLHDDWQWTSGDEVTADDVTMNLNIWRLLGYSSVLWSNMEQIYPEDEKTVVIELGDLNTNYAAQQLFTSDRYVGPPREVNGEETVWVDYLERLRDASTEDEINEIDKEIVSDEDYPIAETVTCGPWEITNSTSTVAELVPNDGFYNDVSFRGRIENFDAAGGRAQPISACLSETIEAGPLPQPEHVEQIQKTDDLEVVIRQGTSVQGLAFNWNTSADGVPEVYTDPKFRQGIAYVLDNDQIGRAHPTRTTAIHRADGVFFNVEEALPNIHDQLRTYETDHERATELLQEAGLSKQDGTWTYDGEPLTIDHISPAYHHWPTTGQATMNQLSEFGFETNFSVNENFGSILWGRTDDTWNSLRTHTTANPASTYMGQMFGGNSMVHYPETVEVPMPVGDWEGEMTEVNVREEVNGLAKLTGQEYTKQLERLAWIYNYTLPSIPTNVENWGMMYWTDEWSWPAKDDPVWGVNYTNRTFMSIPAMSPK